MRQGVRVPPVASTNRDEPAESGLPFLGLPNLEHARAIIDLRAPEEFEADHYPGAVNVPLFENETRAFVGLLYKQFSPEASFNEGVAAVHGRIEALVREVAEAIDWEPPAVDLKARVLEMTSGGIATMDAELTPRLVEPPAGAVVFSCARGGLRSRSVVALMRSIGLTTAVGLEGGYRAYRSHVRDALAQWSPPRHVFALRGLTGVGKTLVLRAIEAKRPGWTLDLEGIAGHRSSLLGMVGLKPTGQKAFETGLFERGNEGFPAQVLCLEGESRKVGDAVIPEPLWRALQEATNIEVTADLERRIRVLSEDYLADETALPRLRHQLEAVEERMEGDLDLAGMLDRGEIDPLVAILLERYYDPLYKRSETGKTYALSVDAPCEEQAADEIIAWIEERVAAAPA